MSYKPTSGMKSAAKRGLELRREYNRGGTAVGVARARDISNGKSLSEDTVLRMYSYFKRHEVDKQGQGWSTDSPKYPSAGKIAWLLWGGNAGYTWATTIRNRIMKEREKSIGMCCDATSKTCGPCSESEMKNMSVTFDIKSYHDEEGERKFSGYANTFDHKDRAGDITQKGAFTKSIKQHIANGTKPLMLMHHDHARPVGVWEKLVEDAKGLYVEGRLTKGVRDAEEAYALLKDGALNSMSIGYKVINDEYDMQKRANLLHEVELFEISLVSIPANAQSTVMSVKSDETVDARALEKHLRDAGLSRREAKAILSKGLSGLSSQRDAEEKEITHNATIDTKQAEQAELGRMLSILRK